MKFLMIILLLSFSVIGHAHAEEKSFGFNLKASYGYQSYNLKINGLEVFDETVPAMAASLSVSYGDWLLSATHRRSKSDYGVFGGDFYRGDGTIQLGKSYYSEGDTSYGSFTYFGGYQSSVIELKENVYEVIDVDGLNFGVSYLGGKFGSDWAYYWGVQGSIQKINSTDLSIDEYKFGLMFNAGIRYYFYNNFSAFSEFTHFKNSCSSDSPFCETLSYLQAGLSYDF